MSDWKITQAIQNGIENGLEKVGDKIAEFFKNMIFDAIDIVLDGASVVITILLIYTGFKFMFIVNREKRLENGNVLVCLFGLYFIVRMLMGMTN